MRVLFCGGGTAGHVNPAIAVAQTIMRNSSDSRIAYVTTLSGIENRLVDFKKYPIDVIGFKRGISLKNIQFFCKQLKAIEECKKIIKEFHPDIIFGTGGYAAYPVIKAGKKMGVKTILHESNVIPGRAIKSLEKDVDRILVNFKESVDYFKSKEKIIHTGNPIRNIPAIDKDSAKRLLGINQKTVILCTSGSLGAERVNRAAMEIVDNIVRNNDDILFVWSTGRNEHAACNEALKQRFPNSLENLVVKDYFDNLPLYMAASDIVISRAGAMTISELAYLGKAAILIPSPNVANNHQLKNAEALKKNNAAEMVTEDIIYSLVDTVKDLMQNNSKREKMERNISAYAIKDANKKIYSILEEMI